MSDFPSSGIGLPDSYATAHVNRAARLLEDDLRPSVVGSYRIIELIGEGGMGEVYKAQQVEPIQRIVALKLIKLGMDSRQVIARFESERQTLAMMNHPHVAAVYDAGINETGRPYFVMEFVPGRAITEFCDERQLTIRQRLELFLQVCDAIQHAHQKTIIHRDLKPSNMLASIEHGAPCVKVIDFGVAKAIAGPLARHTCLTEQGQLVGTPEYMSPEQAELGLADVDTRSDIYSLGIVLYELLTGALPFDRKNFPGSSFDEIRRIIQHTDAPRPSTRLGSLGDDGALQVARRRQTRLADLRHQLRRELEWIPLKALRKEPAGRYGTATELADDIRNYLQQRPLIAGPVSRGYRLKKFLRRNKTAVAASTAMLLLLLCGLIATGTMYLRSESNRVRADREAAIARSEAAKQDAVNSFLNGMLGAINPRRGSIPGRVNVRELKMIDVLAASAQRLDAGHLANQPATEAAVRVTLGYAYLNLGEFDPAEASMRRALELNQQVYGPDTAEVATSLTRVASVLRSRGKPAQAEPLHRQALEMQLRLLGENHSDVCQSYNELGAVYLDQAKFADAVEMLSRSVALRRKLGPPDSGQLITGLRNLANALSGRGQLDEADAALREALASARRSYGEEHYEVAQVLFLLAVSAQRRGDYPHAESVYRQCLAMQRKLLGQEHPLVARTLQFLGHVLCNQRKFDESLATLQLALDMHRKSLGAQHASIAQTLSHIGMVHMGRGDLSEAEAFSRQALDMNRKVAGEDHADVARCLHELATILQAQRKLSEAEQLVRQALVISRKSHGDTHPMIAVELCTLGNVLQAQGRSPEAEPLLLEAMRIQETTLPARHQERAAAASALGAVLCDLGRFPEAEALLLSAVDVFKDAPGVSPSRRRESNERLVRLYESWGKPDQAEHWPPHLRDSESAATTRGTQSD